MMSGGNAEIGTRQDLARPGGVCLGCASGQQRLSGGQLNAAMLMRIEDFLALGLARPGLIWPCKR
jgi:hypothetical protein